LRHTKEKVTDTAKLFKTGRSQAVRLPKKYRFDGDEVYIQRVGAGVMLLPRRPKQTQFDNEPPIERAQPTEQQHRPLLDTMFN
jgi:antitoxin VapB